MDNNTIKWIIDHGHKILIWVQFIIAVVLWITADPSPGDLMDTLRQCLESSG